MKKLFIALLFVTVCSTELTATVNVSKKEKISIFFSKCYNKFKKLPRWKKAVIIGGVVVVAVAGAIIVIKATPIIKAALFGSGTSKTLIPEQTPTPEIEIPQCPPKKMFDLRKGVTLEDMREIVPAEVKCGLEQANQIIPSESISYTDIYGETIEISTPNVTPPSCQELCEQSCLQFDPNSLAFADKPVHGQARWLCEKAICSKICK